MSDLEPGFARSEVPARDVVAVSVDHSGHVTWVYNDDGSWSPRTARDVITDLEIGVRYVAVHAGGRSVVVDAFDGVGKFLSTSPAPSDPNHLLSLPRR